MESPIYTSVLLGAIPHVCKVSIDLLTLAGFSANISMDTPANLGMCTVSLQTCKPWQVYGHFSDCKKLPIDLLTLAGLYTLFLLKLIRH